MQPYRHTPLIPLFRGNKVLPSKSAGLILASNELKRSGASPGEWLQSEVHHELGAFSFEPLSFGCSCLCRARSPHRPVHYAADLHAAVFHTAGCICTRSFRTGPVHAGCRSG